MVKSIMKLMAIISIIASLFGCEKNNPQILDGPGMVYVDSDYRTEYANCLPFDDVHGLPYMAVAYLGHGETGKANINEYTAKIFNSLWKEKLNQIKIYEYDGNDWFLVIPRYRSLVDLKKDEETLCQAACTGEAFVVRCNQDIVVNIFEATDIYYKLSVDKNGRLANTDENVWDITDSDDIFK